MDESFLPYAMLEPLLEEGMTGEQLGLRIFALTGFTRPQYTIRLARGTSGMPLREALRLGVWIVKTKDATPGPSFADQPVR